MGGGRWDILGYCGVELSVQGCGRGGSFAEVDLEAWFLDPFVGEDAAGRGQEVVSVG